MDIQYKFVPRDQLIQGKQYYLYNNATHPATFIGKDETSVYFKSNENNTFAVEDKGPFEGCIPFFADFPDEGFIEVNE